MEFKCLINNMRGGHFMNKKTIILVLAIFLAVSFTFGCTNSQSDGEDQSGDQQEDGQTQDASEGQDNDGQEDSSGDDEGTQQK